MPLRDDILNPIPGENPSGENLRYAPIYDQIKEARREDDDIPQGDWQHEIKKADWVLVTKLASEALATKSKDLQIAGWLTEAMLRREGYAGLQAGLALLRGLIENFWDTLYPELEDGDAELRAAPLDWVGSRLDRPIKNVPLTRGGLDWFKYKESRTVPSEVEAAASESRQQARATAAEEGKLTPEAFDADFDATPAASYESWEAQLAACLEAAAALKVAVEEADPFVPSMVSVWPGANWHERETYDMFGIKFTGHPDLRRLFMPEEFEYFPLRKDFPTMGIPDSLPLPRR